MNKPTQSPNRVNKRYQGGIPALLANIELLHADAVGDLSAEELGALSEQAEGALLNIAAVMDTISRLAEANAHAEAAYQVALSDVSACVNAVNAELGAAVAELSAIRPILDVEYAYQAGYSKGYDTATAESSERRPKP